MKKKIKRIKKGILAVALSAAMVFSNVGGGVMAVAYAEGAEVQETGTEGTEAQETRTEGTEVQETGTKSTEVQETGTEGTEVEETGTEGTEVQETGTEGTEVEETGTEGTEVEETGTEGTEVQETGTEGTEVEEMATIQLEEEIIEEEQIALLAAYTIPGKTINAGSITKNSGETGFYQRLPRLMAKCTSCGRVALEYVPDYYTGNYTLSNPEVLTDCSFTTGSYKGGAEAGDSSYIGLPAAEFNYKAAKGGTTTVTLKIYYAYNAAPESGYCDWCGQHLTYSGNYNEYVDTITFTVNVKQTKYTITYTDGVPGEIVFPDKGYEGLKYGDLTPKFGEDPTREGYTFMGWAPAVAETVTEDVTYVATWKKNEKKFTVTYTDGVSGQIVFADKVFENLEKGSKTPEFGEDPTREGYTFMGWAPAIAKTVTEDVTYVATWEKKEKTFTLKYDANGGENAPATQTATTKEDKHTFTISEQEPTREGYTFEGWSTSKDGDVEYQPSGSIEVTGTTTLYAVWEKNEKTFTLKYDANGGENAPATQTAKARADKYTFTISEQKPTREGFEFKGWSTSKDGNVEHQPSGRIDVTGTTTLYAVWKENITEVSYTVNWYEPQVEKVTFFTKVARFFGAKNAEEAEKLIKTEERTAEVGITVRITENDKTCIKGYTFIEDHKKNKLFDVVREDGSTSLCLYMSKDEPEEPSTEEPTEPSTEEPTEPSTEEPSTEEPTEPSTEEPSTEEPSTEEPSTEEPSTEEPSTEEPSTEEPSTEEPSTEEPSEEVTYRVEWYNTKGNTIKNPETRSAKVGDKVSVTDSDKVVKGYIFDKNNAKNNLEDVVAKDGSTTLKLYFKKKPSKNETDKPSNSSDESNSNSSSKSESSSSSSASATINNAINTEDWRKNYYPYPILICPNDHAPSMSVDTWENQTAKVPRTGEERKSALPYMVLALASGCMAIMLRSRKKKEIDN